MSDFIHIIGTKSTDKDHPKALCGVSLAGRDIDSRHRPSCPACERILATKERLTVASTQPIFKDGDHVLFTRVGGQVPGIVEAVYPPHQDHPHYTYDFISDRRRESFSARCVGDYLTLIPDPIPMAKDLTLREHLIIQFLPTCLTIAKRNNSHPQAARIDLMRCAILLAGGYADLYLEARTP